MMKVAKLRRRPAQFLRLVGVSVEQFDTLFEAVDTAYPTFNAQRLERADRQRAVGGGAPFELPLAERLLLVLVWLRLYLSNELLGYIFGIDASTVSRNLHLLLPLVEQQLPVPAQPRRALPGHAPESAEPAETPEAAPPRRRQKKIGTLEELLRQYPELREVIVDATEQPVQRPTKKRAQKQHYSGKKKRHTRKTQVTSLPNGLIVHLSQSVPGRVHDYTLFHRSGVAGALPPDYGLRVDKGYLGVVKDYPQRRVAIPTKASKHHPLTPAQKRRNRQLARERVPGEHTHSRIKKYRVIGSLYRHAPSGYDALMRTVCGVVNWRTQERLAALAGVH